MRNHRVSDFFILHQTCAVKVRVESKYQLVEYLEGGAKAPEDWRIGTEHEKFVFRLGDHRSLPYDGDPGIAQILNGLRTRFLWKPVTEHGKIIALYSDNGSITLEPGGQLELSGAALKNLHDTCDEVHVHLHQVKTITEPLGLGLLGMGFAPHWERGDIYWMPKKRYAIMHKYMPTVGKLGLDMMLRTATVQVNLDFADESDMVTKFRLSLALQPLATALFANSPFTESRPNGYLSYRSMVWQNTDPARCGMLPFVFEQGMGYERYVDFMLDVPMYFVEREGRLLDAAGQSFRDFLNGRLPALPGETPLIKDWENHLTTAFPEVRLKQYLEMRGADAGSWSNLCALPALWVGLLYDDDCMAEAWDLVSGWSDHDRQVIRNTAPKLGLKTPIPEGSMQNLALRVLEIAERGLKKRNVLNSRDEDEAVYLLPLRAIAESGVTPAEEKLKCFHEQWNGSIKPLFTEYAY